MNLARSVPFNQTARKPVSTLYQQAQSTLPLWPETCSAPAKVHLGAVFVSEQVDAVGAYLTAVQRACHVLKHESHPSELRHARRSLEQVAPGHYLLPILARRAPDLSTRMAAFRHRALHTVLGAFAAVLAIGFIEGLGLYAAVLELWFDHLAREAAHIAGGDLAGRERAP